MIQRLIAFFVAVPLLWLAGCGERDTPLGRIKASGELRFITRNGPTTYYLGRDGEQGIEYQLASQLARELDVELKISQAFTLDELFTALDRGEADIAGAGLSLTAPRSESYASSRAYARQRPQVIYKSGKRRPRTLSELADMRIVVLAGSSHESALETLNADDTLDLQWNSLNASDPVELMQRVNDGQADAAIVDSRDFFITQTLVPRLRVAFDLAEERDIVWYLPGTAKDSDLLTLVDEFLAARETDGTMARLQKRYFERDETISRVDSQTFVVNMRRDLRHYQKLIQIVAQEQELPWELLAAISYQESHWNPDATSRTGVRGMMMLTGRTAKELGVTDRTDPGESMRGGARYFKKLRRRLPDDIAEPDRSWMALAAYNIGRAHLSDARVLTERRGGDPHLWNDVMEALPLLEDSTHYNALRHGYARGSEAVRYVQNIRHYYNVLRWQSARDKRPLPPAEISELLPESLQRLRLRAL